MNALIGWGIAIVVLIGVVWRFLKSYQEKNKTIVDLEYKVEKNEIKEIHKNDSIDDIIARIKQRFGGHKPD